jgi:hypothetical protein
MIWRRVRLAMMVMLAVLGMLALSPAYTRDTAPRDPTRQILVMLKMAPEHYRPDSSYGGAYGDNAAIAARRRIALGIARKNGLELVNGWPMPLLGVDCYIMQVPDGMAIDGAIKSVSQNPAVAWSQPLQTYQARGSPAASENDPLFRVEPAATEWRLADLHRVATGRGVTVAVIDSGVDTAHPDLAGQFAAVRDFLSTSGTVAETHGTGIAGVIAAKAGNGIGIAGIAPDARLMALRACRQTGPNATPGPTLCDSLSLARALQFAIEHNAQVINLSLAGPSDTLLARLIDIALTRKISVVAAFDPKLPQGGFPASLSGVTAVADESLPSLPARVYVAPGRDVPTTQPGGKWYLVNGSSYAAAHVSGLIALARDRRGNGTAIALARTARNAIDACATLVATSASCECSCALAGRIAAGRR